MQYVQYAVRTLDTLVLLATGVISYIHVPLFGTHLLAAAYAAMAVLVLSLIAWPRHSTMERFVGESLIGRVLRACVQAAAPFALTIAVSFMLAPEPAAAPLTTWLLKWGGMVVITVAGQRLVLHGLLRHWRAQGATRQRVAVVGSGELAVKLVSWLETKCPDSVEVVGVFDDRNGHDPGRSRLRQRLSGNTDTLIDLSRTVEIDRIIVALPHAAGRRLIALLQKLKQIPVAISLAPDEVGFATSNNSPSEFGGLHVINIYGRPLDFSQYLTKSLFDRVFAALALLLLSPLLAVTAVAIKLDSKGPVLFRQDRFGLGNKVIKVYKFRTMRTDLLDFGGAKQTQRNDARITWIGNFLRKSSIDELPQLWNVLHGEMSIVGPRPMPLQMRVEDKLNHEIVSEYALRHRVKPGLTGWAQVNGHRGAVDTQEDLRARVTYDLQYIDNWSLWFDIKIILKTISVCVGHQNAY